MSWYRDNPLVDVTTLLGLSIYVYTSTHIQIYFVCITLIWFLSFHRKSKNGTLTLRFYLYVCWSVIRLFFMSHDILSVCIYIPEKTITTI